MVTMIFNNTVLMQSKISNNHWKSKRILTTHYSCLAFNGFFQASAKSSRHCSVLQVSHVHPKSVQNGQSLNISLRSTWLKRYSSNSARVILNQNSNDSVLHESKDVFGDYKTSFGMKTNWELIRALGFFTLCRFTTFTDNSLKVMDVIYRILGQRLGDFLIRHTVYDQFVAGENFLDMSQAIKKLQRGGVGPILACPMEIFSPESGLTEAAFFDENVNKVVDSINKAIQLGDPYPMVQFKYTAFISGELLILVNAFCKMSTYNKHVLNSVVAAMDGETVNFSEFTGWEDFPRERMEELMLGLQRIGKINKAIANHDSIIALADAEYTHMNAALNLIAKSSMVVCNKGHRAKLFYTYQAYLKGTLSELNRDLQFSKDVGFTLGVKLVRGAYIVQERQRASKLGYEDPTNVNFEATTASYYACLDLLLNEMAIMQNTDCPKITTSGPLYAQNDKQKELGTNDKDTDVGAKNSPQQSVRVIIATHNEETTLYAMKRIEELSLPKNTGDTFFGQVFGMADHVSFALGKYGYLVYKSIPYGLIADTLPYLSRRAHENKAILANVRRERSLILKTIRDRIMFRI